MKSLIILFADNFSSFGFENSFDGKSAFDKTLEWAKNVKTASEIEVYCFEDNKELVQKHLEKGISVKAKGSWTNEILFSEMAASLKKSNCEYVIFSFAFNPFINQTLTTNLIDTHEKFKSEYSFADGYPVSVSPELLDRGLVNILSELIKTKDDLKQQTVTKSSVFDLIKTDINSFEIETEISTTDWRLYRFDFSCDKKENYIACVNLYEKIKKLCDEDRADIQKICGAARDDVKVLKTIPGYFNIQIEIEYQSKNPYCPYYKFSGPKEKMSFEKFKGLLEKINELNPDSVVSLSLWGDPVLHPQFFDFVKEVIKYPGLTCLIETDGFKFLENDISSDNSDIIKNLKALSECVQNAGLRKNGFAPVLWLINVDAMTQQTYEKLHPQMKLEYAVNTVKILNSLFSGNVYAQYLRITENEGELEAFYRAYKEKDYISGGKFIIQKYDHFCKVMPEVKSADLSPIERNPCWHLRRDFNILADGKVPVCRDKSFENPCGNAFEEDLSAIFDRNNTILQTHIDKNLCEGCLSCDEYYTYNF